MQPPELIDLFTLAERAFGCKGKSLHKIETDIPNRLSDLRLTPFADLSEDDKLGHLNKMLKLRLAYAFAAQEVARQIGKFFPSACTSIVEFKYPGRKPLNPMNRFNLETYLPDNVDYYCHFYRQNTCPNSIFHFIPNDFYQLLDQWYLSLGLQRGDCGVDIFPEDALKPASGLGATLKKLAELIDQFANMRERIRGTVEGQKKVKMMIASKSCGPRIEKKL